MFNIYRKQIALLGVLAAAFCLCALPSHAQIKKNSNYNYSSFSKKPYYFGITLAYNSSNYKIVYADDFIGHDSISVAKSLTGPGFNLGIVSNLKLGGHFDLRLLPTLSFSERNLKYTNYSDGGLNTRRVNSVYMELPFHVRYKSDPFRDKRVFLIAGVKYGFDVASESKTRQADTIVKISPTDFQLEYGFGVQFFMPYFIFSPEFKVSQGISNILLYNPNLEESNILEKVLSRTFTISLHFEG